MAKSYETIVLSQVTHVSEVNLGPISKLKLAEAFAEVAHIFGLHTFISLNMY
jgi:hypothetical protein